jgi:hypothetical protein
MNRGNFNRWTENTYNDWETKEITDCMADSTWRGTQALTGRLKNLLSPWIPVQYLKGNTSTDWKAKGVTLSMDTCTVPEGEHKHQLED